MASYENKGNNLLLYVSDLILGTIVHMTNLAKFSPTKCFGSLDEMLHCRTRSLHSLNINVLLVNIQVESNEFKGAELFFISIMVGGDCNEDQCSNEIAH